MITIGHLFCLLHVCFCTLYDSWMRLRRYYVTITIVVPFPRTGVTFLVGWLRFVRDLLCLPLVIATWLFPIPRLIVAVLFLLIRIRWFRWIAVVLPSLPCILRFVHLFGGHGLMSRSLYLSRGTSFFVGISCLIWCIDGDLDDSRLPLRAITVLVLFDAILWVIYDNVGIHAFWFRHSFVAVCYVVPCVVRIITRLPISVYRCSDCCLSTLRSVCACYNLITIAERYLFAICSCIPVVICSICSRAGAVVVPLRSALITILLLPFWNFDMILPVSFCNSYMEVVPIPTVIPFSVLLYSFVELLVVSFFLEFSLLLTPFLPFLPLRLLLFCRDVYLLPAVLMRNTFGCLFTWNAFIVVDIACTSLTWNFCARSTTVTCSGGDSLPRCLCSTVFTIPFYVSTICHYLPPCTYSLFVWWPMPWWLLLDIVCSLIYYYGWFAGTLPCPLPIFTFFFAVHCYDYLYVATAFNFWILPLIRSVCSHCCWFITLLKWFLECLQPVTVVDSVDFLFNIFLPCTFTWLSLICHWWVLRSSVTFVLTCCWLYPLFVMRCYSRLLAVLLEFLCSHLFPFSHLVPLLFPLLRFCSIGILWYVIVDAIVILIVPMIVTIVDAVSVPRLFVIQIWPFCCLFAGAMVFPCSLIIYHLMHCCYSSF